MDCVEVQRLVSDTLDGSEVAPLDVAKTREHCRHCPECAAFVRRLDELSKLEIPAPSDEALERAIASALDQHERMRALASLPAETTPAEATPSSKPVEIQKLTWDTVIRRARAHPGQAVMALLAAASVLAFAGWAGVAGMRTILTPGTVSDSTQFTATAPESADTMEPSARGEAGSPLGDSSLAPTIGAPASWIVIDGSVFRMSGPVDIPEEDLGRSSSVISALDTQAPPSRRTVYATDSPDRIVMDVDDQQLAFDLVTRFYDGTHYVLKSGAIDRFGEWPSLPATIREPVAEDGSPTFTLAGTDGAGVSVYRRTTVPVTRGIAIGPGAPTTDPVAGAPVWTWWEAR